MLSPKVADLQKTGWYPVAFDTDHELTVHPGFFEENEKWQQQEKKKSATYGHMRWFLIKSFFEMDHKYFPGKTIIESKLKIILNEYK